MHFPVVIQLGNFSIYLHTVLETVAFFIGFRYFLFLRKRERDVIETSSRKWIIIGSIFGALIGSRILGALEDPAELLRSDNKLLYVYASKTVVGGFLGGLAGVEIIKKLIGEHNASGDLFTFPMILALCIGRLGCFSMGVYEGTHGMTTTIPWGMDLGDGLTRHPVALYEILFLIALWVALANARKRFPLANGAIFKLFMIGYLSFRLILDFIKPHYEWPLGLSTIQLACIAGLLYYSRFIFQPKKLLAVYA